MAEEVPGSAGPPPYQALYRRYRPQHFEEVRGQEHVSRALRNAVREGRVAHAYLFSGPRGTGKTSTARILAMALNCEAPLDGEPDGTCMSCRSIRAGSSMDVFELDAASNRKLDEMRELLSRVALGNPGRWKVYIIDEVHQLTSDAASALLKTLEEPPGHVVFVLATTDPQKVLPTIKSRAQHFEFRLLDGDQLAALLSDINEDAGLGLGPDTISLAVQRARGSARDAESALEQLAALGGPDGGGSHISGLAEALARRDVGAVLEAVAAAINGGTEPRRLGNDLVEHLRNAFLANQAPALVLVASGSTGQLGELAREMGLAFVVRSMETLGQALVDMRDSVDPRVTLEVALVRLASPGADTSVAALAERLERLEKRLSGTVGPTPGLARPASAAAPAPATATAPPLTGAPASTVPSSEAGPSSAPGPLSGPGSGPAQARVALGAYLKGGPRPVPPPGPTSSRSPARPTAPATPEGMPAPAGPAPVPPVEAAPGPGGGATVGLPSRDQLTKAWGDTVLDKLPRQAKVFMANGRFVEVTPEAAVFALPDNGLLSRATNFRSDAEQALADHFGRPVPLRLVLDPGAPPVTVAGSPADDDGYDLDQFADAVDAPSAPPLSAEQRLLQAFPGAVVES